MSRGKEIYREDDARESLYVCIRKVERWMSVGRVRMERDGPGHKSFAVRDRMIDVCSGKKNARFAAVTKWQIRVETSPSTTSRTARGLG